MRAEPRQDLGSAPPAERVTPLYRTIVADPPWQIGDSPPAPRVSDGYAGRGKRPPSLVTVKRRSDPPYPMMSVADICSLRVEATVGEDAHLYLWTINRYLFDSYEVAKAWGFRPAQLLVWCKKPRGIVVGTFTSSTEFVLFARRGSQAATRRIDSTWFLWPRSNTHSRKPEAFYDLVESVSPGPYLELFARRARLGWDYWGDEALEHVALARSEGVTDAVATPKDSGGGR